MRREGKACADIMFDPKWWHKNYGLDFGQKYYENPLYRVEVEQKMKRALFERVGEIGLGEENPEPVPVISTQHCPLCYSISEMFGCKVRWESAAGPWVIEAKLPGETIDEMQPLDVFSTPLAEKLVAEMDLLEKEFGSVAGDINPQGILNNSYRIRGEEIFLDMVDNPDRVHKLHAMVTDAMIEWGRYLRGRTKTAAISVSNIVGNVDDRLYVSSNCMRIMISPDDWETFVLPYEEKLAAALAPFGMHDCGPDMENYADKYIKNSRIEFVEVGWGSDVKRCRELLPEPIHLSARYTPIEMREQSPETIKENVMKLVESGKPHRYFSTSVVAVDDTTADAKVFAFFEGADEAWEDSAAYRKGS